MADDIFQFKCDSCGEVLQEPYIECCECETNFCLSCFSSGREVNKHRNDHKYAVRKNDFPLFDSCNWSAKEECKLLNGISMHGFDWDEITKVVCTRSKLECQEHYRKYYIDNVQYKELDILPHTDQSMFPRILTPYLCSMDVCRDPPRNNQSDQHLAGYNAYRSEFELSYDHNAESIFNIEDTFSDDEEDDCMDALKVSIINAFNNRLRERKRRYKVIQRHGLILPNKTISWAQRFENTLGRQNIDKILGFMQFMTGMQFDAFVESLSMEGELCQKIMRYYEYRKLGIRSFYGARIYKMALKEHDIVVKEQKNVTAMMARQFDGEFSVKCKIFSKEGQLKKFHRKVSPLLIVDLPGFHLLSEDEKELCSSLRLYPQNYFNIKELLIAENAKHGHLRLLDARKIVKIDVNKTRRIYDFLAKEGFITRPIKT